MREYRVADWMSTPPIIIAPTLSLAEAQQVIEQRHVHRLPVAEHGRLIGMLSWNDLRAAQPSSAPFSVFEWRSLLDSAACSTGPRGMRLFPADAARSSPICRCALPTLASSTQRRSAKGICL
jgi:CBS-domain-containing membrane protein